MTSKYNINVLNTDWEDLVHSQQRQTQWNENGREKWAHGQRRQIQCTECGLGACRDIVSKYKINAVNAEWDELVNCKQTEIQCTEY